MQITNIFYLQENGDNMNVKVNSPIISKMVYITFRKEGIHKYPEASYEKSLESVKFLGLEHRHLFYFKIWISVDHLNRDIEFIQFKRWLLSLYSENILVMNDQSCEMMAEQLYHMINLKYPNRTVFIDISEDNENGCYMQWFSHLE